MSKKRLVVAGRRKKNQSTVKQNARCARDGSFFKTENNKKAFFSSTAWLSNKIKCFVDQEVDRGLYLNLREWYRMVEQ